MASCIADEVGKIIDIPYREQDTQAIRLGSVATAALLMGGGQSADRLSTTVANKIFLDFRLTTGATTGYNHGLYVSLEHTSTSPEYTTARFYAINKGTMSGTPSGQAVWATIEEGLGGTNSGLTAAGRFTATAVATVGLTGTRTCIQLDATYAASNSLTGNESFIRAENVGAKKITGFLLDLVNMDTTAMFTGSGDAVAAKYVKCRINGVAYYAMFAAAPA